ncbi:serine/threonine-protein phosphatase 6 regulatory ankyrin repeat subunit A isoform X2 [Aphis gossypii]|uniref:serine/threonine-protein phosphatase 6 regulatory ankyrin repeat subunit A isoform X2 n=1 Tax=Aphis gossypii TaxID=80765 RepID=UPI002158F74C|nr:serine/threonine-protein phosphatase 6 regulatory ankyrin repeat subunit A isoform X2 [Aphis gossypii]
MIGGSGKRGSAAGNSKPPSSTATAAAADDKAATSAGGSSKTDDKKDETKDGVLPTTLPSPGSSIRDGAQRILQLCQKSEWPPLDQALKVVEKLVAAGGEDVTSTPLAGVVDQSNGMTPLMYAVKESKTTFLERLIDLGTDVTIRNMENFNALHLAATYSREDVIKVLLPKKGVDVYCPGGPKQQTAVHMVASRQTGTATSILRVLLGSCGKDIRTIADGDGKIPLLLAVETGNQSMCRELLSTQAVEQLKYKTKSGDMAIHLAAKRKDIDMIKILIDYGASVDSQNGQGQTALHIASADGDESLVKYFYGVRASASITDNQDRTPMHLAAENGHANIIELLVDKFKASIYERTKDGSTLMHIASLNGHADCAMMLFKKGVYLHMPNKSGARSIHTAARYGHVGIINTLLQKGEKVDVTTNDNYTPLHIAVESVKPAVIETLLGYGADVHVRGGKLRETPLHIAARVKDGDRCALMLLKSGAGPNLAMDDGQTPVHVAAQYGNLITLQLLLDDGGDPLFKNKVGETPLHLACRSCQADIVGQLIDFVKSKQGDEVANSYVNSVNEDGASALHYAANIKQTEVNPSKPNNDAKVIKLLFEAGADINLRTKQHHETALHFCAVAGNNEVLTAMLNGMSPTEIQQSMNRQSSVGWTPLLIACHRGHMSLVNTMLNNHARVDVFDNEGRSALHLAAERGYLKVCDALLTHKAFINSKSRVGWTALHLAAMNGFADLCRFLIHDHNAVIDILTLRKQTPLHLAASAGQLEVCRLLLDLGANIDATDDQGQKPIHIAAQNNFPEVVHLFLQQHPQLVLASTKNGNTCAHIAAMQGSVTVIIELMKFDKNGVISARNRITEATPLQLAAEGGHAQVVKVLVRAGASCSDENKAGFTAVHLAAQNGHLPVLEVLRSSQSLKISSKRLGMTALHMAAYCGQTDTVRELLSHIPATVKSDPPSGVSVLGVLGNESGMTPLHFAAYSGNENVVRLLLNSAGVQVDASTVESGYNALHLACFGGHVTVVGLLLSRAADLLHSSDLNGKTCLHIAASYGHYAMVEVLLGQGAEINATDKNGWTAMHCAARAGYLDVVKLLVESGASPKSETNYGASPIWFAAQEGHNDVLEYLMTKEHDTYSLMDDRRFVYNLMICSKNHNNKPIEEFILVSPAPVDTAAKLSSIYINLSNKEKERAKDLIAAGKQCETMATELLALAAGQDSAGRILTASDRRNTEFLDVLIENEQKEVIAHTVVQRYLQELWQGRLNWAGWKTLLMFLGFIACPPLWIVFTLPLWHNYSKVPIIKFMSYLTSHVYLMLLLQMVAITPYYRAARQNLFPYWYEWLLLVWLSGLLLFELTNPSDKSGLGWVKLAVLLWSVIGVAFHLVGFCGLVSNPYLPTVMYLRNQMFAISFLMACVQILDFLSFHHLFGPWAIIIGDLMKDLARFLVVLSIFVFGFSMQIVAMNHPIAKKLERKQTDIFGEVLMSPIDAFELLFFAVFGMATHTELRQASNTDQPPWTVYLFKAVFGIYMLVSVVVLINLLIAMMSDTYQRIQAQSDIEWKFGLAKLIRNMHRTTTTPSPLNLITTWFMYLLEICKKRVKQKKRPSLSQMVDMKTKGRVSARTRMGNKWLSKVKKAQVVPRESISVSVVHLSPYGSQISFASLSNRIETVTDWDSIAKKYRALQGASENDEREDTKASNASMERLTRSNSEAQPDPQPVLANNIKNIP